MRTFGVALRFVLIALVVAALTALLFVIGSAIEVPATGWSLLRLFPIVMIFAFGYSFVGMLLGLPVLQALRAWDLNKNRRSLALAGVPAGGLGAALVNFLFFSSAPDVAVESLKFIVPLGMVGGATAGLLWWHLVERQRLVGI